MPFLASITDRIEQAGLSVQDVSLIDTQIDEAVRTVVAALPDGARTGLALTAAVSATAGLALSDKAVLGFFFDDGTTVRRCREVPLHEVTRYASGGSREATAGYPVAYRKGMKGYVLPALTGGFCTYVPIPALTRDDTEGGIDVDADTVDDVTFPPAFLDCVVYHIQLRLKETELHALRDTLPAAITARTAPTAPSAPAFSYAAATAATIAATTVAALPSAPTYTPAAVSLTAVRTIADLTTGLSSLTAPTLPSPPSAPTLPSAPTGPALPSAPVASTFPTPPSAPAIAYSDATAATVSATSIGALPTAPAYTPVTFATDFATYWDVDYGENNVEKVAEAARRVQLEIQEYLGDIEDAKAVFADGVEEYRAAVQRLIRQAEITAAEAAENARMATDVAVRNEAATMQALVEDYAGTLRLYDIGVQDAAAETQAAVAVYTANSRALLEKFGSDVQAYVAEVQALTNLYDAETGAYQAEVQGAVGKFGAQVADYVARANAIIQAYRANTEQELGLAALERPVEIQQYGIATENAANTLSAAVAAYTAGVQRVIEQARLTAQEAIEQAGLTTNVALQNALQTLAASVQEYSASLDLYRADLTAYQGAIDEQKNIFTSALELFKSKALTLRAELKDLEKRFVMSLETYKRLHTAPTHSIIRSAWMPGYS